MGISLGNELDGDHTYHEAGYRHRAVRCQRELHSVPQANICGKHRARDSKHHAWDRWLPRGLRDLCSKFVVWTWDGPRFYRSEREWCHWPASCTYITVIKGTGVSLGTEIIQSGGTSKLRGVRKQGGAAVASLSRKLVVGLSKAFTRLPTIWYMPLANRLVCSRREVP